MARNRERGLLAVLAATAGLMALTGCDKLTRKHFDMLQVGSSDRMEVEKTIGDDRHPGFDDLWHYERIDKHMNVLIHFDDKGVVSRKEWHDMVNSIHVDTGEGKEMPSIYESTRVRTRD